MAVASSLTLGCINDGGLLRWWQCPGKREESKQREGNLFNSVIQYFNF